MKVLVVSGFLGAGKTTFIKELLRRVKKNIVIMENEYGDINLDSKELSKSSNKLEILEFMEGCVCCTMKDSFKNSVLTVQSTLDPDYLIIEPTGIAKLSNTLENINQISYEKISLLKPIMVLSPRSFFSNLNEYKEVYVDQIKNAAMIIFSKAENDDDSFLNQVSQNIYDINNDVEIIKEHYSKQTDDFFENLLKDVNDHDIVSQEDDNISLDEITCKKAYLESLPELILFLEDIIHGTFGEIIRAKGTIKVGKEFLRFDIADGLYGIIGEEGNESQCVFIGNNIKVDKLLSRINTSLKIEGHNKNIYYR